MKPKPLDWWVFAFVVIGGVEIIIGIQIMFGYGPALLASGAASIGLGVVIAKANAS